jgi:predicted nucleotidyltransferase
VPAVQYRKVLQVLLKHEVDFIVVGGVAAVLNGAPINTYDLDVVHSAASENILRLLSALEELDAVYRIQPERRLRPNASHLVSPGHQLLNTVFGSVDFLGTIGDRQWYKDLLPHSTEMDLGLNRQVRVLNLDALIQAKEKAGREKDNAVLPTLRATLRESLRKS